MNKKNIIIGTTALNRPLLHIDNIPEWYNWINNVDKNIYNIIWFINIDYMEKLQSTIEETCNNFNKIIIDIPVIYLGNGKTGNFLNACKRISSNIETYVNDNQLNNQNIIIIWLEDDWKLNTNNIPLQDLIENYLSNLTCINLSFIRLNYIHALAPCIINYELWSKLHLQAWKNQKEHIDPEHCVGKYFLNNYSKYEELNNITIINKKIDKNFFNNSFLNYEKSFYTFHNNNNIINDRFIKKKDIINFNKDKITFIRITPTYCIDNCNYGRQFMKKYDIIKTHLQDKNNIDFYK
jgi:hypothetical protein